MSGHDWQMCRPTVPTLPGPDPEYLTELTRAATARVWHRLPPADRQAYHSLTCLGERNDHNQAVVDRFRVAVVDQAAVDQARHAAAAGAALCVMDQMGVQTFTPRPGETVVVMVVRVRDALLLGDDPPPLAAKRRRIEPCSRCGEDCWLDPLSHGQATPVPVCMRCLDPAIGQALDEAIGRSR